MFINGQSLLDMAPIKNMLKDKQRFEGTSHGLAEAGYDIRIKQEIFFIPNVPDIGPAVFIKDGDREEMIEGRFILASAIEEFEMPLRLVGNVKDKSSWARKGVSVFNTVIEPGWNGFLTLELVFNGNERVHIKPGQGIAQVLFGLLRNEGDYGEGKYQNQEDKPVEARK